MLAQLLVGFVGVLCRWPGPERCRECMKMCTKTKGLVCRNVSGCRLCAFLCTVRAHWCRSVRWVNNWPNGWALKVVVSGAKSGWRPAAANEAQRAILGAVLLHILINVLGEVVMTQNWGEWLTHQRAAQPCRGILTGWRGGLTRTS